MLLSQQSSSCSIYMVGHTTLGLGAVTEFLYIPYMVGRVPLFWVLFPLMIWSIPHWLWVLNLVILVWWFGIRLMNLLASGWWSIFCLITHLPWFHGLGANTNPLPTWTRVWGLLFFFLTKHLENLSMVLIQSSATLSENWSWMHPSMSLIPYLIQSLKDFILSSYQI